MELNEFVKETLSQITAGIAAAQSNVRDYGGFVNPAHRVNPHNSNETHFGVLKNGQNIFLVDFDVSVTVIEESSGEANAKLQVASLFKAGGGVTTGSSNSATNRISFKVPLCLPVDIVSAENLKQQDEERAQKERELTRSLQNHNRGSNSWMSR